MSDDQVLDGITASLTEHIGDTAVIVTGYIAIAEFTGSSGEQLIFVDTPEEQRCHRTLGLLEYVAATERAKAALSRDDDDE